jgi:SAM-dependent methyltransferase
VRGALAALGNIDDHVLIDLGCGKGRVTVLASELPFLKVIGVELSPHLVKIAKKNANIIARNFPHRPLINIFEANATEFPFPKGNLVIFFYHAFGRELLIQVVKRLELLLLKEVTHMFFIYDNPVCGDVLDASPAFIRWYAEMIPHDPIGTDGGSIRSDAVVIWQSVRDARPSPDQNRDSAIDLVDTLTAKLAVTSTRGCSFADAPA